MKYLLEFLFISFFLFLDVKIVRKKDIIWSAEKANEWYAHHPWLVGYNFIPSTTVNQLEMGQQETFDPETIERELDFAHQIGFNSIRVYLHYLP